MQTMLTGILSETENEFDRVARDMRFYAQLEQEQIEIEQYVNECLIYASGNKRAINEMAVLHEAALGDKIKGFFTKIKNFFKKIFDKLGAAINGVIIEQKKYIEKYQYIITKCKYQAGDVNDVYNHFLGISRIVDAADNADTSIIGKNAERYCEGGTNDDRLIKMDQYQTADKIMQVDIDKEYPMIKPEEQKKQAFEDFLKESYWTGIDGFKPENDANGNVDPTATFKAYFNGSYDTVTWSIDEVENNMNTIINTVYAGQAYMKKLEKIVASVNKKTDEMQKKMEDYYKAQKDKIVTSAKPTDTSSNANDGNDDAVKKEQKKGEKAAAEVKDTPPEDGQNQTGNGQNNPEEQQKTSAPKESYRYTYGTPVVEMNIGSSSNGNTENKGDSKSGAGGKELTNASDANKKIQDKTVATQQAKDNNMDKTGATDNNQLAEKTEKLINRDIERRQALVNADIMISTTIANQMFAAFKLCNSDFFSIIKAHVQWYLGNPGAEKQTDNQAGRPHQLDMTATVGGIKRNSGNTTATT
jgi:hypothetical protein